jgi:LysM domain-containing protein
MGAGARSVPMDRPGLGRNLARGSDVCKHMFECGLDFEQVFGEDGDVSRTRVRSWRKLAVVAAVPFCLLAWSDLLARGAQHADAIAQVQRPQRYVVEPGDTLWSIASRIDAGRDPRVVVDAIVRANGIADARVVPGESLVLPAATS